MHGHRQEEDGVAVVSSGAGTEVLLHGLHDREELLSQSHHVMEQDLQERSAGRSEQLSPNCRGA